MQKAHEQTDQVLTTLDTTLRVVFESLQQDIQAIKTPFLKDSTSYMGWGNRGEVMFTTLVNRLAEQLGREASTYLHSQTSPDLPEAKIDPQRSLPRNSTESAKISLPYPGTEMSTGRSEGIVPQPPEAPSNPPDPSETISHTD
ncbi:MAG: hypothetical protein HC936_06280 [Leptolyngbyaceae cyanobacterium SU_3_3]|nr:hypothetical protein [Leptolyngbyaceae cyanobacterium SU_3_3]